MFRISTNECVAVKAVFCLAIASLHFYDKRAYDSYFDLIQALFAFGVTFILFVNFLSQKHRHGLIKIVFIFFFVGEFYHIARGSYVGGIYYDHYNEPFDSYSGLIKFDYAVETLSMLFLTIPLFVYFASRIGNKKPEENVNIPLRHSSGVSEEMSEMDNSWNNSND